jgi:hypothetical protein
VSSKEITDAPEVGGAMHPIAIAGMHRAGTSMIANALRLAGLYLGPDANFLPPATDNPSGFFEHAGFVHFNEDLLAATGGAWDHLPACPPMAADDPRVAPLRDRATQLVDELAVVPTWGWKDPRTSLTVRFWLDVVPDLRVVVCLRHPLEVALSLKRRNNTSYAHGLSLWHGYYNALVDAVPRDRRIVTHYDAHFRDPTAEAARLIDFAGLPQAGVPEAVAARDPGLRHHRLDITLGEAGVDPETTQLYERLRSEAGDPIAPTRPVEQSSTPARVDRNAFDLLLAKQDVERYGRQVISLQRQRAELADRVAELEARGGRDVFSGIHARLDRLEDSIHELRYALLDLGGRDDADALRRCRGLVRAHVDESEEVLVIAKGDPVWLDLHGRTTGNFPQDAFNGYPGFPFAHGIAAIAHLEARRLRGSRFLLVPEFAAWWTERFPEFAAHLTRRYEVVADEPGAGMLVDLRARRAAADASQGAPVRFVVAGADPDPVWLAQLEEALADESEAAIVTSPVRWADVRDDEVIAVLEVGVLPLPGCCDAARAILASDDRVGAVAPKLLAADGSIEAAGTAVFADGSWAGVAAGSHEVVASWHEFVRETCGGAGLLFISPAALEKLGTHASTPWAGIPTSWAGDVWAERLRVLYQPGAAAVRATGAPDTSAASTARVAEAWAPALPARPSRPDPLDDAAWQGLLQSDDVGASWAAKRPA